MKLTAILKLPGAASITLYMLLVLGHASERLVQVTQALIFNWQRSDSLGLLGLWLPELIRNEMLHFSYNLVQLAGLLLLADHFRDKAGVWWKVATLAQSWHMLEHTLLIGQYLTGSNLFGASVQTSMGQLLLPRIELHFIYVTLVLIPTMVAIREKLRSRLPA